MRVIKRAGFATLLLVCFMPALAAWAAQTRPPRSESLELESVQTRIADLIRVWTFAGMFHPARSAHGEVWDAALLAAIPKVIDAKDAPQSAAAADAMLAVLGDSSASVAASEPHDSAGGVQAPAPFRVEDGAVVASCIGIAKVMEPGMDAKRLFEPYAVTAARHGLVIDCRDFASPSAESAFFRQATRSNDWLRGFIGARLGSSIDNGYRQVRFHDGFPPDEGSTSGDYESGLAIIALSPWIAAAGSSEALPRVSFLFDETTPAVWQLAGGLQQAGLARIVVEGAGQHDVQYPLALRSVYARVATARYLYADGRVGFKPDACVTRGASAEAMRLAIALLSEAMPGRGCSSAQAARTLPIDAGALDEPQVGVAQRLLALAKLWGTLEYFNPYKDLADEPWEEMLDRYVPVFMNATTRAAYEEAVMRLTHYVDDSHVFVSGMTESAMGLNAWAPPLYVRPIAGGYGIAGLHPGAADAGLRVGDEILAVDAAGVAEITAKLAPLISASTAQSRAALFARFLTQGREGTDARLTIRRDAGRTYDLVVRRTLSVGAAASRPATSEPAWKLIEAGIGYVDLERLSLENADRAIDELLQSRAIIFDLRGYPHGTAWVIAPRLAHAGREHAVAARFRRPHYRGPDEPQGKSNSFEQHLPPTDKPRYAGRVIVLIDDRAISQSEHTALFFKAAAHPVFIGSPTTGANGDVTRIKLPGALRVSFTGHDVTFPDGRRLQRTGILPDMEVTPTWAGVRAGRDEVLDRALAVARGDDHEARSQPTMRTQGESDGSQ